MTWWGWVIVGVLAWRLFVAEWRRYRNANSSSLLREGPKKGPPQAEAEDGHHHHIEYGGHHLP